METNTRKLVSLPMALLTPGHCSGYHVCGTGGTETQYDGNLYPGFGGGVYCRYLPGHETGTPAGDHSKRLS